MAYGFRKSEIKTNMVLVTGLFFVIGLFILLINIFFTILNVKELKNEVEIKAVTSQLKHASLKIRDELNRVDEFISVAYPEFQYQMELEKKFDFDNDLLKKESSSIVDALFKINKEISGVALFTNKGEIIPYYNFYSPYYYGADTSQGYYNIDAYRNSTDYIIQRKEYDNRGEYIQFIKIFKETDSPGKEGIIVEKNIGLIKNYIEDMTFPAEGNLILVNNEAEVIFSTNKNDIQFLDKKILNHLNGSSGIASDLKINGLNKYIFYDRSVLYGCNVLFLLPSQYIEGYNFSAKYLIALSFFLCLLVMVINTVVFIKKVYNPVTNAERILRNMATGNADVEIAGVENTKFLNSLSLDLKSIAQRIDKLMKSEHSSKILLKQAELDALQNQINPHFLYNTLETIRGQAISKGAGDIEQMTKALAELFRYSIRDNGSMVRLEEELRNVDNYLIIQKYRFSNKFTVVHKIDEDTLNHRVPKLLIQPLVENAFQHGLETKSGDGRIILCSYRTQNRLLIQIQDDGIGISKEKLDEINEYLECTYEKPKKNKNIHSIGLINVSERIRLNFGTEYGIKLFSSEDMGTIVEVSLPLV